MEYPESYKNLKYRERLFIDCYLNESLEEPQTHKNTFSDKFVSYIFAYNVDVSEFLDFKYTKMNYITKSFDTVGSYDSDCTVTVIVTNAKKYMSVLSNSTKIYNRVIGAINDIRQIMYDSNDKSKVLELKDAIYQSSIHSSDAKDRNDNRRMAMKIFGLDQVKVDVGFDIYEASGKNILQGLRGNIDTTKEDAPLIPDDIDDIDLSEEEE